MIESVSELCVEMKSQMRVEALGYVGVRAKELGDWASYGANLLGLQRVDKTRATMAFRMDDRKQRIIVHADGGEGIDVFGWEAADAGALDGLAARLEAAGTKVARGSRALADERTALTYQPPLSDTEKKDFDRLFTTWLNAPQTEKDAAAEELSRSVESAANTETITRPSGVALRLNSCARAAIFLFCSGSPAGPTRDRSLS